MNLIKKLNSDHYTVNICDCEIWKFDCINTCLSSVHFEKLLYLGLHQPHSTFKYMTYHASDQMKSTCNSNVMAITCHIFECNALHYNYVMRKNCPLQITFQYFENVIHYNYITITIVPGLR